MGLDQKKYGWCNAIFFYVPDPEKISGQPDELDIRVQIDWTTGYKVQAMALSPVLYRYNWGPFWLPKTNEANYLHENNSCVLSNINLHFWLNNRFFSMVIGKTLWLSLDVNLPKFSYVHNMASFQVTERLGFASSLCSFFQQPRNIWLFKPFYGSKKE